MDVTIPLSNLKRFTASLTCLSKIGKDLYISFDPFDGLTLSSLNEAKSAYAKFHFECGFFEKCLGLTMPTTATRQHDDEEDTDQWRYVCRVPVRSVHSILRPRKGVLSLRIRSEGHDDSGKHFGVNRKNKDDNKRNNANDKVPYSSRRRKRKSREEATRQENNDPKDKMMLTFEYCMERIPPPTANKQSTTAITATFTALHKIAVTDAHGITLSTSTHRKSRSEIIAPPKLWMRLLDPLKTQEVALTIDDALKVVTATSFHPSQEQGGEHNAVLAATRLNAVLKTETSTGVEEFDEYDYRNNRRGEKNDELEAEERMPEEVNERVILVFSIKEAKVCLFYIEKLCFVESSCELTLVVSLFTFFQRQCYTSALRPTPHITMMVMHYQYYLFIGVDGLLLLRRMGITSRRNWCWLPYIMG